ncbi:TPA: helix-turn-helix transcriptional regulator [Enterobacter kobei]|jgi:DNA-binding transcriptional ArsR family regulator|uniref:helix-turn-helix domain-containing protein n=1 Tax=Citrobacter freundii TaxID=546 RepID=UPI0025C9F925|nr:helix-turn-helix domain-containing protein [Citrobacter freundii]HCM9684552.1 helix-turn-helix transcriptional regulator [Enterobacter kobei]EJR7285360.1 helix-turn-helix transcriptional regulator [Citrobacter freundii]EKW8512514.1 helix-turn-helix transcriptional regulator [Citrobacter freundii]EMB4321520.1 helix-turn-helix transcriptional regulator [Citrobacter freundii]MDN4239149.1 helix-turn-helix domain-containing protein [Citrobacter freundii]
MIRSAWFKMPSTWMRNEGLREFKWSNDQLGAPAAKIAALQIYYSIAMSLEFVEMRGAYDMKINCYVSTATFNRFRALTGLSRALITAGVEVLERAGLIKRYREGKRCFYEIVGYVPGGGGWCKVPLRKVLGTAGEIVPFHRFKLRRKIELYAMKFYLYICFARDNTTEGTYASFETINKATGIPEKEIPSTYSFLIAVGLINRVDKGNEDSFDPAKRANTYYVTGSREFFARI